MDLDDRKLEKAEKLLNLWGKLKDKSDIADIEVIFQGKEKTALNKDGEVEVRREEKKLYLILTSPLPGGKEIDTNLIFKALKREGLGEETASFVISLLKRRGAIIKEEKLYLPPTKEKEKFTVIKEADYISPILSEKKEEESVISKPSPVAPVVEEEKITKEPLIHQLIEDSQITFSNLDKQIKVLDEFLELMHDSSLDAQLKIEYDNPELKTACFVSIIPPKIKGRMLTLKQSMDKLQEEGIKNIDTRILKNLLDKRIFNRSFLVAKGITPTKGKDAELIYKFGIFPDQPAPTNLQEIEAIPGQLIAVKKEAELGSPGKSVKGEELAAERGEDIELIPGKNVYISLDKLRLYSASYGEIHWTRLGERRYKVDCIRSLRISQEEIPSLQGNITFPGKVEIEGDLPEGMVIKAEEDINVKGNIAAKVKLESGKNINIGGTIDGKGETKIQATGNITVGGEVKEANLLATGNIWVGERIINSLIEGRIISLGGRYSEIIGGRLTATLGIEAKVAGREKEHVPTELIIKPNHGDEFKPRINISVYIHPKVKVIIGQAMQEIRKTQRRVSFFAEGKRLISQTYEPLPDKFFKEEEEIIPHEISFTEIPPSIVIRASSIEKCKKEGASLLSLSIPRIDYQVLEEKDNSNLLRLFPKGQHGPWEKDWKSTVSSVTQQEGEIELYQITSTYEGLFLRVLPGATKPTPESIYKRLKTIGYKDIDEYSIKSAVDERIGEMIKIGPRQFMPNLDGEVLVQVSPDYKQATVIITPAQIGGLPVRYDDVISALNKKGVKCGIKEGSIQEALSEGKYNTPILAAEMIPPSVGSAAKIELLFPSHRQVEIFEDETGRVNFKTIYKITNVKAKDKIAIKIPPTKGQPGRLIDGREIEGILGEDIKLPAGRNVEVSPDGLEMFATIDGYLVHLQDKINVEDVYTIAGDVDLSSGNIYFLGTVIIEGEVKDGFKVEVSGDIQVKKGVGKAELIAGGNIIVGEGIKGHFGATLEAKGDIIAKYVEHAHLKAGGAVLVSEGILHSNVEADNYVKVEGKRGVIIGGKVTAGEKVRAKDIGCEISTQTLIEVGGRPKIRTNLANLEKIFAHDKNTLEKLKLNILNLRQILEKKGYLDEEKERLLYRLLGEQNKLTSKLHRYIEQKEYFLAQLASSWEGKVEVEEKLYPGVTIRIRTAEMYIKNTLSKVTLICEGGKIVVQ